MDRQYNQDHWNPPDKVEGTSNFAIERPVSSDADAHRSWWMSWKCQTTPVGGAGAAVSPQNGTAQAEADLNEKVIHIEPASMNVETIVPFFSHEEAENLRTRWNEIQIKFVDDPHSAVQQADALVAEVIEKITRLLDDEHSSLESEWDKNVGASTEDLRKALQRFRSFFNRLVA